MRPILALALLRLWVGVSYANPGISADLPGGAKMEFVWIEPGTFAMGSPAAEPARDSDESPQYQVTISKGFYLGKYEVTQRQWQAVMGTQPWSGQSYVQARPDNPAGHISWDDVQGFIHKLNQAAGDSLYRLPTEAEWEYACRAGVMARWLFGDDQDLLRDYAWYYDNAWAIAEQDHAHAVGTKLPNPWGLYDMHGNVWEWVQDWHGGYSNSDQTDPQGPPSGSYRVLRGGSFFNFARNTRSANRYAGTPAGRGNYLGARLLKSK